MAKKKEETVSIFVLSRQLSIEMLTAYESPMALLIDPGLAGRMNGSLATRDSCWGGLWLYPSGRDGTASASPSRSHRTTGTFATCPNMLLALLVQDTSMPLCCWMEKVDERYSIAKAEQTDVRTTCSSKSPDVIPQRKTFSNICISSTRPRGDMVRIRKMPLNVIK